MDQQAHCVSIPPASDGDIAVANVRSDSRYQAAQAVTAAIAEACARGWRKLLIEITAGPGFAAPSLAMRAEMTRDWAAAAQGRVIVAMVCPIEFIDPHRFGVSMARNFGMVANVFVDEASARDWLLHSTAT